MLALALVVVAAAWPVLAEDHLDFVKPVVSEINKSFTPLSDGIVTAMRDMGKAHLDSTKMLIAELRKPRKRTLVRGKDGRATHMIEE